jgi:hypothetical protein
MVLFDPADITPSVKPSFPSGGIHHSKAKDVAYAMVNESFTALHSRLGDLKQGNYYHLISQGHWSAIHLLKYLLLQTGPAAVRISSWSISENSVRGMVALLQEGHITDLKCLFDFRVSQHTPGALALARQNFDLKILMCHAKITAIQGDKLGAVVIGSANYNDNKRLEAAVVSTLPEDVAYWFDFINEKYHEE